MGLLSGLVNGIFKDFKKKYRSSVISFDRRDSETAFELLRDMLNRTDTTGNIFEKRQKADINYIRALYNARINGKYMHTLAEIIEKTGIRRSLLEQYVGDYGRNQRIDYLKELYDARTNGKYHYTLDSIAERIGMTRHMVGKYIDKYGWKQRNPRIPIKVKLDAIDAYQFSDKKVSEILQQYNISERSLYRMLKKGGIPLRRARHPKEPETQKREIERETPPIYPEIPGKEKKRPQHEDMPEPTRPTVH